MGEDDSSQQTPIKYGHQLADQYCGIMCGKWALTENGKTELANSDTKVLLYINAHYELPEADLREAINAIEKRMKKHCVQKGMECQINAENYIFWIGWRDLYNIIKDSHSKYTCGELNYLIDLEELLEIRDFTAIPTFIY